MFVLVLSHSRRRKNESSHLDDVGLNWTTRKPRRYGVCSHPEEQDLLETREAVWRAWFANDQKTLQQLVPADTIAINSGEENWEYQPEILQSAADFQSHGGKLIRLEFPRTEIRRYGDVA